MERVKGRRPAGCWGGRGIRDDGGCRRRGPLLRAGILGARCSRGASPRSKAGCALRSHGEGGHDARAAERSGVGGWVKWLPAAATGAAHLRQGYGGQARPGYTEPSRQAGSPRTKAPLLRAWTGPKWWRWRELKSAGLYPDSGCFPRSEGKCFPSPPPPRHQEASKGLLRHGMPVQNRYTIQPGFGARPGGRGARGKRAVEMGILSPSYLKIRRKPCRIARPPRGAQ